MEWGKYMLRQDEQPKIATGVLQTVPTLNLFETGQMLGYVEGFLLQAGITELPPGAVASVDLSIPKDERWLWALCGFDVSHDCALLVKVEWTLPLRMQRRSQLIFVDGSWNKKSACPPGWRPFAEDTTITLTFANVTDYTGNPEFDAFEPIANLRNGSTAIDISYTGFMIRLKKWFADSVDKLVERVLSISP